MKLSNMLLAALSFGAISCSKKIINTPPEKNNDPEGYIEEVENNLLKRSTTKLNDSIDIIKSPKTIDYKYCPTCGRG